MKLKKLYKKYFNNGNVIVTGLRGRGKDMLTANIIARYEKQYISNFDYNCKSEYINLDFNKLDCKNDYKNLISGNINYYEYPYPKGVNIYVSDAGIYFPSQFCSELDRKFIYMPTFQALSRQLGRCQFHCNVQNINRLYTKIKEMSDFYITCNFCKVLFGKIVIQCITIYDKYESCLNRVEPFIPLKPPLFTLNSTNKAMYKVKNEELRRSYLERNGVVKRRLLIYVNKSNYDTYYFDKLFKREI